METNNPGNAGPVNDGGHNAQDLTPIADALTRADAAADKADFRRAIGELAEAISLVHAREIFTARRFIVAGPDGKPAIELSTDERGEPRIRILDCAGMVRAELSTDGGEPALRLMDSDGETRARLSVGPEGLPGAQEDIDADRTSEAAGGLFLGGLASRPKVSIVAGNDGAAVRLLDRTGEPAATLMVEDLQRGDGDVIATMALTPGGILPAEESGMPIDSKRLALTLSADGNGSGALRIDGEIKTDAKPGDRPLLTMALSGGQAELLLRTEEAAIQRIVEGGSVTSFEGPRAATQVFGGLG